MATDEPLLPPPGDAQAARDAMARIAAPFDRSRDRPWPQVEAFIRAATGPLLDLAAGNGRHAVFAARSGLRAVAADVSGEVLRLARAKAGDEKVGVACVETDALRLPFRDRVFAAVVFVAGVHCIRGRGRRIQALEEMRRVLTKDGRALVSVWTRDQDRFRAIVEDQERRIWDLRAAYTRRGMTGPPPEVGDVDVPWAHGVPESVSRFFHLYDAPELQDDLERAGLAVDAIEPATLTRSSRPDNLFATVRRA